MSSDRFDPGAIRHELASAIRQINAQHAEIGSPKLTGLDRAWRRLDSDLAVAKAAGDEIGCRHAVERYRLAALEAINKGETK